MQYQHAKHVMPQNAETNHKNEIPSTKPIYGILTHTQVETKEATKRRPYTKKQLFTNTYYNVISVEHVV